MNTELELLKSIKFVQKYSKIYYTLGSYDKLFNISISIEDALSHIELDSWNKLTYKKEEEIDDEEIHEEEEEENVVDEKDQEIMNYCDGKTICNCGYNQVQEYDKLAIQICLDYQEVQKEEENKNLKAIKQAIDVGHITIKDRLFNTKCLCGNN